MQSISSIKGIFLPIFLILILFIVVDCTKPSLEAKSNESAGSKVIQPTEKQFQLEKYLTSRADERPATRPMDARSGERSENAN